VFNLNGIFCKKKKKMSGRFKTRLFTADTISYFKGLLLKETLEVIYQEHDINKIFNNFFEKISQYFLI